MLSISHAVTGVAIATSLPNPYLAIPLILLSHYLLDAIPHWDAGTGLGNGSKSRKKALVQEIPDLFLAALACVVFFPLPPVLPSTFPEILSLPQLWGFFFALLPDFLEAPRNFLRFEPWLLKPINRFHHWFHHSISRPLDGLAPQIVLLTLLWLTR